MSRVRFGLIGTGFIGRTHAIALNAAGAVFGERFAPVCELLADHTEEAAQRGARALGFARSTGDWRQLIADPAIDVVDICTPNYLHRDMALAAIGAGKHVYCEKPLANTAREAREIAAAADAAGVRHLIGFNYICNPLLQVAREMIAAGVRKFAGGLGPASTLRPQPNGELLLTDGPYLETKEHIGGFWILECADMDEALAWVRKGAKACRAPIEVQEIFFYPAPDIAQFLSGEATE